MARPRPSTLKLWRFLLDVCAVLERRPGYSSSYDIADDLQTYYEDMLPEVRRKHFGADDEDDDLKPGFPSQSTVLRYIEWIEEDLKGFFPGRRLIPRMGSGTGTSFGPPTSRDVQLVRTMGVGLFNQLDKLAEEKRPLILAGSNAVGDFLLPRVDVAQLLGQNFQLRTAHYTPSAVVQSLLAGEWDAAVGWERGDHKHQDNDNARIWSRPLASSECSIRLLFHPSYKRDGEPKNRLAAMKREYMQKQQNDPNGFAFSLTPTDLKGTLLLYPNVPHVVRIGDAFRKRELAKGFQLDHFVSVLNAVRTNQGIGLFFGLPWLIRELEHEHHLISAGLTLPDDWNHNTTLKLRAFTRKNDSSEVTREATKVANALIGALEAMLVNFGVPPPGQPPEWELAGPAQPEQVLFEHGKKWHLRYVTGGRYDVVPLPRWTEWWITFDITGKAQQSHGWLYREGDDSKPVMEVWVEKGASTDGFLILRFKRIENDSTLADHTIAYFPARVVKKIKTNTPAFTGVCFLGSLNYAVGNRPFCSPILLSDQPLTKEICKNIAHSHVIDFLSGTEPDD